MKAINAQANYEKTKKAIGYVPRRKATLKDYQRIGFMSGLEVHQQLKTKKKLFCHCPAGIYHDNDNYSAEVIRHMRPTLSELGEYDGTALMEFKTRKQIIYRIHNVTACTYEIDDTPPFPINREALEIALEISLVSNLNIVGEVHITRKQYLDGSIPTGFQRSAILGVEGEIQLSNKKVRLIQLSIEEDSCREISDVGHVRVYKTDRLGMPLIETVTYPDMLTPEELREAAEIIRFLNRSTGKVRIGIGTGREDVNVSCRGGTRVEIKGVSHNRWIPELSHNESFRQWALLHVREILNKKINHPKTWKINSVPIDPRNHEFKAEAILTALERKYRLVGVNLPGFRGILSHFTQPGKSFNDEISDRLKVIACIERPNMISSEDLTYDLPPKDLKYLQSVLHPGEDDAHLLLMGLEEDLPTALETIEERCLMAFEGIPRETRKSFPDGTTIFERVLPGANRMYPDTDSPPIPLAEETIEQLRNNLPVNVSERYQQMKKWSIPADTYPYLLRNNLIPLMEKINKDTGIGYKFLGTFLGHTLKNLEGKHRHHKNFNYNKIYGLFRFIHGMKLEPVISKLMLPIIYEYPDMEFESVLTTLKYRKLNLDELLVPVDFLYEKYKENCRSGDKEDILHWMMGQVQRQAIGNIPLAELYTNMSHRLEMLRKE